MGGMSHFFVRLRMIQIQGRSLNPSTPTSARQPMSLKTFILIMLLPVASACAQSETPSDSLGSADIQRFTTACMKTSNMGEDICGCAARKAKSDLSEKGFAFLLATLEEDADATEKLRGEMGVMEAMKAGMFLASAPAACAADQAPEDQDSDGGTP